MSSSARAVTFSQAGLIHLEVPAPGRQRSVDAQPLRGSGRELRARGAKLRPGAVQLRSLREPLGLLGGQAMALDAQ
eukprot:8603836-Lingulodinium_polyedra.AAC.1